ncbi:hypothetical protein C8F04DRAFT_976719, partial [Mycena alexandri]
PPPPPPRESPPPLPPRDSPPPLPPCESPAPPPPRELASPEPLPESWRRGDMHDWPEELRRAHAAFAMGIEWGKEWSELVTRYLEFEGACGYQEDGPRIGGEKKPEEVGKWISRGRKWFSPPRIANVGAVGEMGSYAENWWVWWRSLQPVERVLIEETGMMSFPAKLSWGKLTKLHGRNGFMQVMASLLWWGLAMKGDGEKTAWLEAVTDVVCILTGVIQSGEAT